MAGDVIVAATQKVVLHPCGSWLHYMTELYSNWIGSVHSNVPKGQLDWMALHGYYRVRETIWLKSCCAVVQKGVACGDELPQIKKSS